MSYRHVYKQHPYLTNKQGIYPVKKKSYVVLDDGTESMRIVMFSDQISKLLPESDLFDEGKAMAFRDDFLGTEVFLSGNVKKNQLFENLEIIVNDIKKIEVEELITSLEKKE